MCPGSVVRGRRIQGSYCTLWNGLRNVTCLPFLSGFYHILEANCWHTLVCGRWPPPSPLNPPPSATQLLNAVVWAVVWIICHLTWSFVTSSTLMFIILLMLIHNVTLLSVSFENPRVKERTRRHQPRSKVPSLTPEFPQKVPSSAHWGFLPYPSMSSTGGSSIWPSQSLQEQLRPGAPGTCSSSS